MLIVYKIKTVFLFQINISYALITHKLDDVLTHHTEDSEYRQNCQ